MTRRIDNADTDADIQLRAYLDSKNPISFVMVAGAGSGKTTSLIKALDYIGKRHGSRLRQRGQKIACITYTEIAVKEIQGDVGEDALFHVSTIHSFLWQLVKSFQSDIKTWVIQRINTKLNEAIERRESFGTRTQQRTRDNNEIDILNLKAQLITMPSVNHFNYETGSDYSNGILGHDDIVKMVPELIRVKPLLATIIAKKYPFFFVDESQDTIPDVVEALKTVDHLRPNEFCLGFFGDPMQKIYVTGIGNIALEDRWEKITKPENFRCPTSVLSVINNIRVGGDGLEQTLGKRQLIDGVFQSVAGNACAFVLPADEYRDQNLNRVRSWLAKECQDIQWTSDDREADVRILVIVHRMAAKRLGFFDLYSAFNDNNAPDSFKSSFSEGTAWPLKPFQTVLLPLVQAFNQNRHFEVMTLLRAHCPKFDKESLKKMNGSSAELLASVKKAVDELSMLLSNTGTNSIMEVLQFVDRVQLIQLDERLRAYLISRDEREKTENGKEDIPNVEETNVDEPSGVITAFLGCPACQLWGYQKYMSDESPYSTQQGIKGAEFARVLVVLDDEESTHPQFSYDKLLGIRAPSPTDVANRKDNKETVHDRTRRLFYVCCSRATKDLAVVLYTHEVKTAIECLKTNNIFDPNQIHTIDELL